VVVIPYLMLLHPQAVVWERILLMAVLVVLVVEHAQAQVELELRVKELMEQLVKLLQVQFMQQAVVVALHLLVLLVQQQGQELHKELKKKFDVERVGLFAALNQATDEETRLRIKSLIAIKDQDTALAGQLKATLDATLAMENFGKATYGVLTNFLNFGQFAIGERDTLRQMGIGIVPENPGGINPPNYGALDVPLSAGSFAIGERDTLREMGIGATNITINATGIGDQQIAAVVQNAIQELNRYGNSTTYAGAI